MTSTLFDLCKLAVASSNGSDPLVATALQRTVRNSPASRFAPGFALLDRADGTLIWRAGAVPGVTADIHAERGTGTALLLMATKSPPEDFHSLAAELLAAVKAS